MPHSSSDWHGTSILSAIPKHIVAPRKQRPSDTTIPIIPMSPSPSYYSLGNQRKPAKTVGLHTFKGVVKTSGQLVLTRARRDVDGLSVPREGEEEDEPAMYNSTTVGQPRGISQPKLAMTEK